MNKNLETKYEFSDSEKENVWEIETLDDICEYWNGGSHEDGVCKDGGYNLISLNSINIEGNLKSDMKKISYTDNSLKRGNLVMVLSDVAHGNFLGLTAIIPGDNYVLNQRMAGLRIKDESKNNADYIRYYININQKYFKTHGQGSSQLNLSKKSVTDFPVLKPKKIKFQKKIADCLSSLDEVITAYEEKLKAIQNHKKGLMQNLFPQEGKTVPNYRFPEFKNDGDWKERNFDSIATFLKGKGISKADIVDDGKTPCIRYGELYTTYKETIDKVVSYTDIPVKDLVFSKANDVIIPSSGETQLDIATASCVLNDNIALGGDLNIIRSTSNGVFLSYYLNNAKKYEIARMAQGNAVVHLYPHQLKTLNLQLPEINEQQKIANCLSSVDELKVELLNKIEQLKLHKKGLMQGLFPKIEE